MFNNMPFHIMLFPATLITLIFCYIPMFGSIMAFQNFSPALGFLKSEWIGLDNFKYVLGMGDSFRVLWNTVYIAFYKIAFNLIVPITVSIMLNEVRKAKFKKILQTSIYLPFFISWVILGSIFIDVFSLNGPINTLLNSFGIKSILFLGDNSWFPKVLISTDVWKNFGYNTVVYLAAITSLDPNLYEAATIDGANRWQRIRHITLTGMVPIIMIMTILNIGNILNAGFEQIFVMYSPIVYKSSDIIDTLVYRMGIIDMQFGPAAAIGLFKSVVSLIFVSSAYLIARKYTDYRLF